MITEMTKDQVTEIGSRNRASYLLEQYGYTHGLAKLDGQELVELLPEGYLEEVAQAAERVSTAMKDRTLSAEEAKGSTQAVNEILRQAKVWRRAVVSRATRARRMGKTIPAGLLSMDGVEGVPGIATQVDKMLKLIEANEDKLPGANLGAVIEEGKSLVASLKTVDATQEVKRLKSLPDAVRKFYHEKGLLFIGLKVINDAGRELHAHDASNAAKYNLSILYRHTGKRKSAAMAKA